MHSHKTEENYQLNVPVTTLPTGELLRTIEEAIIIICNYGVLYYRASRMQGRRRRDAHNVQLFRSDLV